MAASFSQRGGRPIRRLPYALVHYWFFIGHFDDQLPIHAGIPEFDSTAGNDTGPTVQRFGNTGTLSGACRYGMLLPEQVAGP